MARRSRLAALAGLALVLSAPLTARAQDSQGFDGYIQSGTCQTPTEAMRVNLDSAKDRDVEPYFARDRQTGAPVFVGYYGAPEAAGFGLSAIYTDQRFSLVISDASTGHPLACGDILQPESDTYREAGLALVQLLPVEGSTVQGVAAIQRTRLQRELDITPTRVGIVLSEGLTAGAADLARAGYEAAVQSGSCQAPAERVRVQLRSREESDAKPYLGRSHGSGGPVTLAYYGAAGAPGFGLAAVYTGTGFSIVVTQTEAGAPLACGDILVPEDDSFTDAGLALVQLRPVRDSGLQGFALVERVVLQRELDVTPTRVRLILFAPPATS